MKLKKKKKILLLILISGIFLTINKNIVLANTKVILNQTKVENIYYTRRGGNLDYVSNPYYTYEIEGKVVYCIEPLSSVETLEYVGEKGFINSPYDNETTKLIELIGHYGYDYPGHQTINYRMATQSLIWEITSNQIIEFWTEMYGNGDYINLDKEKEIIMSLVNSHYTLPSFNNLELDIIIGETKTIIDTNNVLENYEVSTENAIVSINKNILSITPTKVGQINIILNKKKYDNASTIIYINPEVKTQAMGLLRFHEQVQSNINISVIGGELQIDKLDSETNSSTPQGEASLEGAIYGVYDLNENLVKEMKTDSNSSASSGKILNLGRYYIQEITPSKGYLLDQNKYYFDITKENLNPTIKVLEKVISSKLEINKFYSNTKTGILKPEEGIVFQVYNKDKLIEEITTDKDGFTTTNLVYGTYTIKQKNTTPGYELIKDFEVTINESTPSTIKYSFTNNPITTRLKLEKIDSESKKTILSANSQFKIKDLESNEYICQSNEDECIFKTNENGIFITPKILTVGAYQIEEITPPKGYILSNEKITFTIDEKSNYLEDNYGEYILISFENTKITGHLTIAINEEKPIFKDDEINYEETPQEDSVIEVYANEDIITLDGIKHYEKGELVTKLATNERGIISIDNLLLGKYYIQDLSANNNEKQEFELIQIDSNTRIIYQTINIKKPCEKGTLIFTKQDSLTKKTLSNAVIEIYNEQDKLLFTKITDEQGNIVIEDLPLGKYYLVEKVSPEGYNINKEKLNFEIKKDQEVVNITMTNEKIITDQSSLIIDVPNTEINKTYLVEIISSLLIITGIGIILYEYKKRNIQK